MGRRALEIGDVGEVYCTWTVLIPAVTLAMVHKFINNGLSFYATFLIPQECIAYNKLCVV